MKTFVQNYAIDGCKHEYRCPHTHGWKEQEYHPLNYKIHVCRQGYACHKAHCPYYHDETDRREALGPEFRAFPRNRGGPGAVSFSTAVCSQFASLYLNQLFTIPARSQPTKMEVPEQQKN
jgi:hypothetical protein